MKDFNEYMEECGCRKEPPEYRDETYWHISNGGVTFSIERRGEEMLLVIDGSSFGIQLGKMELPTDAGSVRRLAEMLGLAAERCRDATGPENYPGAFDRQSRDERSGSNSDCGCEAGEKTA